MTKKEGFFIPENRPQKLGRISSECLIHSQSSCGLNCLYSNPLIGPCYPVPQDHTHIPYHILTIVSIVFPYSGAPAKLESKFPEFSQPSQLHLDDSRLGEVGCRGTFKQFFILYIHSSLRETSVGEGYITKMFLLLL